MGDDLFFTGFPRSGNTFFGLLLRVTFPEKKISTHFHAISGIKQAVKCRIPTVVVIRQPAESVSSWCVKNDFTSECEIENILREYINYFTGLRRLANQKKVLVIVFDDLITHTDQYLSEISRLLSWADVDSNLTDNISYVKRRIDSLVSEYPDSAKSFDNNEKRLRKIEIKSVINSKTSLLSLAQQLYDEIAEFHSVRVSYDK